MSLCDLRTLLEEVAVRQRMNLVSLCRMDLRDDIRDSQLKEVILVSLDICESQDFRLTAVTHCFLCKIEPYKVRINVKHAVRNEYTIISLIYRVLYSKES